MPCDNRTGNHNLFLNSAYLLPCSGGRSFITSPYIAHQFEDPNLQDCSFPSRSHRVVPSCPVHSDESISLSECHGRLMTCECYEYLPYNSPVNSYPLGTHLMPPGLASHCGLPTVALPCPAIEHRFAGVASRAYHSIGRSSAQHTTPMPPESSATSYNLFPGASHVDVSNGTISHAGGDMYNVNNIYYIRGPHDLEPHYHEPSHDGLSIKRRRTTLLALPEGVVIPGPLGSAATGTRTTFRYSFFSEEGRLSPKIRINCLRMDVDR